MKRKRKRRPRGWVEVGARAEGRRPCPLCGAKAQSKSLPEGFYIGCPSGACPFVRYALEPCRLDAVRVWNNIVDQAKEDIPTWVSKPCEQAEPRGRAKAASFYLSGNAHGVWITDNFRCAARFERAGHEVAVPIKGHPFNTVDIFRHQDAKPTMADWDDFVRKVRERFGIEISPRRRPHYLGREAIL